MMWWEGDMAERNEVVWDAVDPEAMKLLDTDPDAYFAKTRRQPFGFVAPERSKDADSK